MKKNSGIFFYKETIVNFITLIIISDNKKILYNFILKTSQLKKINK